jgi:hypothetical protein
MQIRHLIAALATGLFAAAASANINFSTTGDDFGRFQATTDGQLTVTYLGGDTFGGNYVVLPGTGKLWSHMDVGSSFTGSYHAGDTLPLVFGC